MSESEMLSDAMRYAELQQGVVLNDAWYSRIYGAMLYAKL